MWLLQMKRSIIAGFDLSCLVVFAAIFAGCSGPPPIKEIARITSPDSLVDAVLAERGVDATVATPSEVYIVPKGGHPVGQPLLRADHMQGLTLVWRQPRLLELHYTKGRIFSFSNFWESPDVQSSTYVVELRLVPASDAYSLD